MNDETLTPTTSTFPCDQCDRSFQSVPALRMHKVRTHGKGWDTSANFRKDRITKAGKLEKRREYQRKLRARYKRTGRDSRGYPLGGNKGMKLPAWSPERRAKFNSTWLSKRHSKPAKASSSRIRYIYPDPATTQTISDTVVSKIVTLKYCPNCGEHLGGWINKDNKL